MNFSDKPHIRCIRRSILLFLLILSLLASTMTLSADTNRKAHPNSDPDHFSSSHPGNLTENMLSATSAIALDAATGRVLFSKNPDREIYPASTTKVLTALLAIERLSLDEVVEVSRNCMVGESSIYLEEGEKITVRDLLYGLLLKSGNDAAVALAEAVSGSVADFATLMNQRAVELGCTDSHFTNSNGLPDSEHYTTASDYGKIVREAAQHEEFIEIVSTYKYELSIEKADGGTRTYTVKNTNALLPEYGGEYVYENIIGGKTGYTDAAQHAFVSVCENEGRRIITVVFGDTKEGKWYDTMHLADYCFATYRTLPFAEIYEASPLSVQVSGTSEEDDGNLLLSLDSKSADKLSSVLCTDEEISAISSSLALYIHAEYPSELTAPIQADTEVGTLFFSMEDMEDVEVPLLASRTVASAIKTKDKTQATPAPATVTQGGLKISTIAVKEGGWSNLYLLVIIPLVLFVILLIWLIAEINRAKQEKRKRAKAARTAAVNRERALRTYDRMTQDGRNPIRQGRKSGSAPTRLNASPASSRPNASPASSRPTASPSATHTRTFGTKSEPPKPTPKAPQRSDVFSTTPPTRK